MPRRYTALLALLLAISSSMAAVSRASSVGGAAAAADAAAEPADPAEAESASQQEPPPPLPLEYFPVMRPFQRCLFVCRHCYQSRSESRLLHCANSWCLSRVRKSLPLPTRAYQECPTMRLID